MNTPGLTFTFQVLYVGEPTLAVKLMKNMKGPIESQCAFWATVET